MKKFKGYWLMALIAILVITAGCGGSKTGDGSAKNSGAANDSSAKANDKVITLKIADSNPVTHSQTVNGVKIFMQRATELTNGRVKFEHYPSGQLGKAQDMLDLVKTGVTDIGYIVPDYVGKLPLSTAAELPGSYKSPQEGSKFFAELIKNYLLEKEYLPLGIRPLYTISGPGTEVFNTKREVKMPADLKGLKIRVSGGVAELSITALGGTPVNGPASEAYEAVQRGTMDGSSQSWQGIKNNKLFEIVKYGTVGAPLGGFLGTMSINEKVWQQLPQDIKDALLQAAEEARANLSNADDKNNQEAVKDIESKGIKVNRLTPEEQKAWAERTQTVWDEWIKNQEKAGLAGTEAVKEWRKIIGK